MDSGGIWVFFLTDKTSYHKHLKWDKKWDNPNREVRYDVDKMESGLEKPYLLQRIAGKRFVEVVEVRGFEPPASSSRTKHATRLRHTSTVCTV